MTHLPYVLGCYGLALLVAGGLGVSAALRLRAARRKLAAVDPRGAYAAPPAAREAVP